jgi:hypothetical protein
VPLLRERARGVRRARARTRGVARRGGARGRPGDAAPPQPGLIWLGILHWRRKSIRYKITERTIDYELGVLTRRVETLQLWRVQDLDLRQTLMDRLLGVAEIRIFTKDASDPEIVLRGLPASREIFEALKNAAELSRQQRVVGLVQ